jgi:hypothetical protein|tara:strand:- start:3169 stop:3348 length:180 start_codon:yes stop_codon:yes gene_type:complete
MQTNELLELDKLVMHEILTDLISGTLLTEVDTETADLILTGIWEMPEQYEQHGVIIGYA